ncbi:Hypothetical protein A7982_10803 [Minicystis rosea]|nr:Hypothetical protein A7982_10803 [Minicystis rosea]
MKPKPAHDPSVHDERWLSVMYDAAAIDGDIDLVIGRLRRAHGYTFEKASTELVRRLSATTP